MVLRLLIGVLIGGGIGALMGYFGKCTSGTCPLTANPVRGMIVGALLGSLFSLSCGYRQSERSGETPGSGKKASSTSEEKKAQFQEKQETLIHVNSEADFRKYVLNAKLPCLADFFSNSCPPCRMLAPIIEKLAEEYKGRAVICKVSLAHAETQGLAQRYGIRGIPAVIFFDKGEETKRLVGLMRKKTYLKVLDKMIETSTRPAKGK